MKTDKAILLGVLLAAAVSLYRAAVKRDDAAKPGDATTGGELDSLLQEVIVTARRIAEPVTAAIAETEFRIAYSLRGAPYRDAFEQATVRNNLPPDLLARMAYQESRFRQDIITGKIVSSAGAVGIMQIVPRFHPAAEPLNPAKAIAYAGGYLAGLYRQFSSWKLAVAAYNAGPGNVAKYRTVPPFKETQDYVAQIGRDIPEVAAGRATLLS